MISMEFLIASGVGFVTATGIYLLLRRRTFPVVLGLAEESGEVLGKIKKVYRDDNGNISTEKMKEIEKELGDVLW